MNKRAVRIVFVIVLPIFLNMLFMFKALGIEGEQYDHWWTDSQGNNHQGEPPGPSSSSSSYEYNPNSGAAQFGRQLGQAIRSALGLDYTPPVYTPPPPETPERKRAKELNLQGIKYRANGENDEAIECYEQALTLSPDDEIIKRNLTIARQAKFNDIGLKYCKEYNWEMGIKYFKEALSYGPDSTIEENLRIAKARLKEAEHQKEELAKKEEARRLNDNDCLQYRQSGDFDKSFSCYEKAISLNPTDPVIKNNLQLAKMDKANTLALKYFKEQNWKMAIKYLKEALSYGSDENIKDSLAKAEGTAKLEKQEKAEDAHRIDLAGAKERINKVVGDLAGGFDGSANTEGSSNPLEFIGGNQPPFSEGDKNSAPVVLSEKEPGKEAEVLVDPSKIDGIVKESGLNIKEVPLPKAADPYFSKPKTDIILDALERGRINGKNQPSNLDISVKYVKDYLLTRDPENAHAREALSYLEGMRESAALHPENLSSKEWLDEQITLSAHGISQPKSAGNWPEKNPEAKPQGLTLPKNVPIDDYIPKSEGSQQLTEAASHIKPSQAPNEVLKQWREQRTSAVYYALREGKGDVNQAIDFLTNKINKNPEFSSDSPARSALNYLHGYQGYKDYEEKLKK